MLKEATAKLMKAIPFSESDLAANQRGELTASQIIRIKAKTKSNFLWISLFYVLFYSPFLFVFGVNWFTVGLGISGLFFISVWLMDIVGKYQSGQGIGVAEGKVDGTVVAMEEDRTDRIIPDYENRINAQFSLKIGGTKFRVKERIFDAFSDGTVRVYYFSTPVKIILSAEVLEVETHRQNELFSTKFT